MKSTPSPTPVAIPLEKTPSLVSLYTELTKIRLSALTVVTTGVGFVMASPLGVNWVMLFWTILGTMACACSASALNQFVEHDKDKLMHRTSNRPIPAGHLSKVHAFVFGVILAYIGVGILSFLANVDAAGIALFTILLYVLVYTPLKTRTSSNTLVGAVVGALPPLIGWVAASGGMGSGGLILASLLFIWQLPHFLALAWVYREDYERGGFVMLPSLDRTGKLTAKASFITSLCLIPLTLLLTITGSTGVLFAILGGLLGLWVVYRSFQFWKLRDDVTAKKLFYSTIIYLPLLLMVMLIDRNTIQWVEMANSPNV